MLNINVNIRLLKLQSMIALAEGLGSQEAGEGGWQWAKLDRDMTVLLHTSAPPTAPCVYLQHLGYNAV